MRYQRFKGLNRAIAGEGRFRMEDFARALAGASGINFWPVWIAGAIGAALGDWVTYWFGYKYKEQVAQIWPLSRYPEILPRGEEFVKKWGVPSIFIGRFFGPLRASVPLAAGIFEM